MPLKLRQDAFWTPDGDEGAGRAARWTAFIMVISGWVIIGITALGATERLRDPT